MVGAEAREAERWLQRRVLPVQRQNLILVELWHVVVLEHVEDALERAVEEVAPDPRLLVLLDLFWRRALRAAATFGYLLHLKEAGLDLLKLFVDDQA